MVASAKNQVLVFGSFDPLHDGHRDMFAQARSWGERLLVVVTSDAQIRAQKGHEPYVPEAERRAQVAAEPAVDAAMVGQQAGEEYRLLRELDFAVLAVGYDQHPEDAVITDILRSIGKEEVKLVRLKPYRPEQFKSSLFKD